MRADHCANSAVQRNHERIGQMTHLVAQNSDHGIVKCFERLLQSTVLVKELTGDFLSLKRPFREPGRMRA